MRAAEATETAGEDEDEDEDSNGLAIAALVVGGLGLVAGVGGLMRSRGSLSRMRALAAGIVVVAALMGAQASIGAPAPHPSKSCGVTAKGEREYRVKARGVKCRFARRWVKRYLRRGREAGGFNCVETDGGQAPFYCTKGASKAYWAERL